MVRSAQRSLRPLVDDALRLLGIRRFALAIHDVSYPSFSDEDVGRGSPYSQGGLAFLHFARDLGFNAIQMGPQGITTPADPSPYDSSIFSKSTLSLAGRTLQQDSLIGPILPQGEIETLLSEAGMRKTLHDQADYELAREVTDRLLDLAYECFLSRGASVPHLGTAFASYLAGQRSAPLDWFERECIYEALCASAGTDDWRRWGPSGIGGSSLDPRLYLSGNGEEGACSQRIEQVRRERARTIERFAFGQFLLYLLHERMKREARSSGMILYGDMHIGFSHRDRWAWRSLFLPGYSLGAPPSRTNTAGQPWDYPVLHPELVYSTGPGGEVTGGPALKFVQARAQKLLSDFEGIRIDHPQGLVCPWVYRAGLPDPHLAVQRGARLYSSPDLPDHPELSRFSLVRPDQINRARDYPRHGDEYVTELSPEQIERYAVLLDEIFDAAKSFGRDRGDILCEVLSTWPRPLKEVMRRRGLGRFCITQKADPNKPDDVYRAENTSAIDWIMIGNHDTKPLRLIVEERRSSRWIRDRSLLLAQNVEPQAGKRPEFAARLARDERLFCEAMFAELFLSPACQVSVFFGDLMGEKRSYNIPGTVNERNWTLRLPSDYQRIYFDRVERGEAFDIPKVLALALKAKAGSLGPEAISLSEKLSHPN